MAVFYLLSKRVVRSIPYGHNARNRLDMYVPRNHWKAPDTRLPVVIYVTGAFAWNDFHLLTRRIPSLKSICIKVRRHRRRLDNWVQGVGLAAGQAAEQAGHHRVLPRLSQLPAGNKRNQFHATDLLYSH